MASNGDGININVNTALASPMVPTVQPSQGDLVLDVALRLQKRFNAHRTLDALETQPVRFGTESTERAALVIRTIPSECNELP